MKILELKIENFRSIREQTIVFSDYTALVGPNGSGKSNVLTALRIFFRDSVGSAMDLVTLREEDFHLKDTSREIAITVVFGDLDSAAQEEFQHYYRQEKLIVSAVAAWDSVTKSATVKQYGQRLGMKAFAEFFKFQKSGATIEDLKKSFDTLTTTFPDLPKAATRPAMLKALNEFEAAHPELCELLRSEDEFYGFSKGANRLQKFIQWVFIPAVKDASSEQLEAKKNALGVLLERTVRSKLSFEAGLGELRSSYEREYQVLLESHKTALDSLSLSLSQRMKEWAHPDAKVQLQWHSDVSKYISIDEPLAQVLAAEGRFTGEIARFGHGFQRSFLFVLLQELAGCQHQGDPRLILACEEPELHQHPPQAKHLASVLQTLSTKNSQVLLCTHSPYFISGSGFENVRLVRKDIRTQESHIRQISFDQLADRIAAAKGSRPLTPGDIELKIEQALQPELNEIFFSSVLILVEGLEDLAYINTYLTLMKLWEKFRSLGCHIVCTGGKGRMIHPLAIAGMLEIPTFVVFDADGHDIVKSGRREQHEGDNLAILRLCSIDNPDPFPKSTFEDQNVVMWSTEIGQIVAQDFGDGQWATFDNSVRKKQGITAGDLEKNVLFIGSVLNEAWTEGKRSKILEGLCTSILAFAGKCHFDGNAIEQQQAAGEGREVGGS